MKVIDLQNSLIKCNSLLMENDKLINLLQVSIRNANEKTLILDSQLRINEVLLLSEVKQGSFNMYNKEILLIGFLGLAFLGIYSYFAINSTQVALVSKQITNAGDVSNVVIKNVTETVVKSLTDKDQIMMIKLNNIESNNVIAIKTLNTTLIEYCNKILTRIDLLPISINSSDLSPPPLDSLGGLDDLILNNPIPINIIETLISSNP